MPRCNGCGGFVTKKFVQVFGIDGTVEACIQCASVTGPARRFVDDG